MTRKEELEILIEKVATDLEESTQDLCNQITTEILKVLPNIVNNVNILIKYNAEYESIKKTNPKKSKN